MRVHNSDWRIHGPVHTTTMLLDGTLIAETDDRAGMVRRKVFHPDGREEAYTIINGEYAPEPRAALARAKEK